MMHNRRLHIDINLKLLSKSVTTAILAAIIRRRRTIHISYRRRESSVECLSSDAISSQDYNIPLPSLQYLKGRSMEKEEVFIGWVDQEQQAPDSSSTINMIKPLDLIKSSSLSSAHKSRNTVDKATADGFNVDKGLKAIGITNQRETTVFWSKSTGVALYNAIVWMDDRTTSICRYNERFDHKTIMLDLGILSASDDGTIRLWAVTGEVLVEMVGRTAIAYSIGAHKSRLVVSGNEDGSAKMWKDEVCVQSIEHPGCVWDVKFMENGDIVTACSDGVIQLKHMNLKHMLLYLFITKAACILLRSYISNCAPCNIT